MQLIDLLLPELDRELGTTRRLIERIPPTVWDWRPHRRARTFGALAAHVGRLPRWIERIMTATSFDLEHAGADTIIDVPPRREAVLVSFDRDTARARGLLRARHDGELLAPWTLTRGTATVMTAPRIVMVRYVVVSHLIHHRGQLTVYFRLCGLPVPAVYGPSADEGRW